MSQILANVGFDHLNLWVSRPQRMTASRPWCFSLRPQNTHLSTALPSGGAPNNLIAEQLNNLKFDPALCPPF